MSDIDYKGSQQSGFGSEGGHEPGSLDALQDEGYNPESETPALGGIPVDGATHVRKKKGAIVLIVVIGLAMGSLFSMHTLTKVSASSGKSTDIQKVVDEYLNRLSPSPDNPETASSLIQDHTEVVAVLTDDFRKHQVGQLERNPFKTFDRGVASPQDNSDYSKAQVQERFESAASEIVLKSVMGGSRPIAIINGQIVNLNKTFKVEGSFGPAVNFTVVEITRDTVKVVAEEPSLGVRVERVVKIKQ